MLFSQPRLLASEPSTWSSNSRPILPRPPQSRWRGDGRQHRAGRNNIGLLNALHGPDAELARRRFTMTNVAAGTTLMHQGAVGDYFYCLLDGEVSVHRNGQLIDRVGPGAFFGELALLPHIAGSRGFRQASIVTTAPSRLAICDQAGFDYLVRTFADVQRQVIFQARAFALRTASFTSGVVDQMAN